MKRLLLILCLATASPLIQAQPKTPAAKSSPVTPGAVTGKVVETMNTAGYTYVLVDSGKEKVWVAAVQFEVKKGDTVAIASGMPMPNYYSKTLKRDFDLVYFAADVQVNGKSKKADALPPGHPPLAGADSNLPKGHPPVADVNAVPKAEPMQKAAGGKTVAEIHAGKAKLKGKPIVVRGRVVKYNAGILGKNWLHIQDGSGTASLVVTTDAVAKPGNIVLVNGNVSTDRDFGSGYKYDLIVENAKVTVE